MTSALRQLEEEQVREEGHLSGYLRSDTDGQGRSWL